MHVKMRVNTENYFALFRQMNHPVLLLRRDALPTRSQDRTLTVQNKAPIRSQTSGPATRGERRAAVDKSTPRTLANPSTSQAGPVVHLHRMSSVPTITFPTHALPDAITVDDFPVTSGGIRWRLVGVQRYRCASMSNCHVQRVPSKAGTFK